MQRLLSSLAIPLSLSLVACFPEEVESPPPAAEVSDEDAIRVALQRVNDLRGTFGLSGEHGFSPRAVMRDSLGQVHVRFHQLYRGVRVWGGEVISHASADGRAMAPTNALALVSGVDVTPALSAAEVAAQQEQRLAPLAGYRRRPLVKTELVVVPELERRISPARAHLPESEINALDMVHELSGYRLAYHVHVEIEEPTDTRHTDSLIDARTGEVLQQWNALQTAAAVGTGNSQYNGVKPLHTNSVAGGFELRDLTRPASGGNVVYDLNHATSGTGTIYTDTDNTWGDGLNYKEDPEPTTSPNGQTAAVDAAYGIQVTWDMYKNVLGRNGINGAGGGTYARVHYGYTFDNAFYNDSCGCMTYGDGNTRYTYTALDVAAHEFTHGVTSATARLIYSQESGGLNESTSDIMGAVTEFYSRGAGGTGPTVPSTGGTWTQGEQLVIPGSGVNRQRYLYKPSLDTRSADAWSPTLKNLDVHYSSGPMNRAFYFLSMGATASGDTSSTYLPGGMAGIGIDKAVRIYYRALTTYMTPSTDYAAARIAVITAARDLYNTNSAEEIAVWNAFAGINVGGVWAGPDAVPTVAVGQSGRAGTITFSANASDDKGIAKVDFTLDGILAGTDTTAPYALPYDSTLEDDGTHTLLARATDSAGLFATSSMSFTIDNGQLLKNASFEKGYGVGWSNTSGMQIGAILNTPSFDGTKAAKFRGMGSAGSVSLFQTVSIPANATSVALSYALWVQTQESSTAARDTFTVQLRNTAGTVLTTLATHSNLNASATYQTYSFDLAAYKGQTVQVTFTGTEDGAISTGFILDRTRLLTNGTGGGDTTAPTVSVSATGTSGVISFAASASDNVGVAKVEFLVDGVLKGTDTTSPYGLTLDSTGLANGSHTLVGKAYDAAGNVGTSSGVTFTVNNSTGDTTAPTVTASVVGTSGTITLAASASDNVGVTSVEFLIDGVSRGSDATSPYSLAFDSSALTNGSHTLVARAFDAAGNVGTSSSVTFTVSNTGSTTFNEVEANGSTAAANAVGDPVTKIVGHLGSSTDQDFFRVNVAAGRTITVNMTGPARDYDLYLLSATGTTLRTSAGGTATESVTYTSTAAATFYIKVVGFGGAFDTTNPYNLNLTR